MTASPDAQRHETSLNAPIKKPSRMLLRRHRLTQTQILLQNLHALGRGLGRKAQARVGQRAAADLILIHAFPGIEYCQRNGLRATYCFTVMVGIISALADLFSYRVLIFECPADRGNAH